MGTKSIHRNLCLRASAAIALAGCLSFSAAATAFAQDATPPPAAQQSAPSDSAIQSAVASALARDAALDGQHVTATAARGIVTLTGNVKTEQQRQAAETTAANVDGVSGIENNIRVNGKPAAGAVTPIPSSDNQTSQNQAPPPPPMDNDQAPPPPDQNQRTAAGNPPPPPPVEGQSSAPRQPYQAQPGYAQPLPPPQYRSYPPSPQPISGPVTVPAGTLLQIRTDQPLDMSRVKAGQTFEATAASDVFEGNVLAIPRGALLEGTVVEVKKPGALGGNGELQLQITSLNLGGRSYPLSTDTWSSKSPNKAGYTARNTVGGSLLGAIIGGALGGGGGAAAGAVVGGVGGMAASAASNPRAILPPETVLNFHVSAPVTVQPVSWQEAQRLAQNAPQLQRRPVYMARPYPYGYPYYRAYGW